MSGSVQTFRDKLDAGTDTPSGFKGRRVLIIGRSPEVNQGVVRPLLDLGIAAIGFTQPEEASRRFNARDFELIVFGRGALRPVSDRLKVEFAEQNPNARFVDAIQPVAVKQTLAALLHDPRTPRFVSTFRVVREGTNDRITATILASCHVTLTVYRVGESGLVSDVLADFDIQPGLFERRSDTFHLANSLLLTANEEEYHLHPFL